MTNSTLTLLRDHAQITKDQFHRNLLTTGESIPFQEIVDANFLQDLAEKLKIEYRNRIFNPMTTVWTFLSQVLSADQSCRNAVTQFIASKAAQLGRKPACSSATGAYCLARQKLPEEFFEACAKEVGTRLVNKAQKEQEWLWKEREVLLADGSLLTLEDTKENQKEYPFSLKSKKKPSFPMVRVVALLSLSVGAVIDMRIGPYLGRGSGESPMLMKMLNSIRKGTVLAFDRLFANYFIIAKCLEQGIDIVSRFSASRRLDLAKGKRLAKNDYIITIQRPEAESTTIDKEGVKLLPKEMRVRIVVVHVHVKGFRSKKLHLVTTLLDHKKYPSPDIAILYGLRWQCELDLRSIKAIMKMNRLRCKTPSMVRKEIWIHILAYNIIRTIMAQACVIRKKLLPDQDQKKRQSEQNENSKGSLIFSNKSPLPSPRQISFSAALQGFNAFRPILTGAKLKTIEWREYFLCMLQTIAVQKLTHRPFRIEPRAIRRRNKRYSCMHQPRAEARKHYWKSGNAAKIRRRALSAS